jgi:prevent-host-death family protein
METSVGIRDLKDHLSEYVARVSSGETITLTRHNRPVARLVPVEDGAARMSTEEKLWKLVREGKIHWGGGKPKGSDEPTDMHHAPVADAVIEDRR